MENTEAAALTPNHWMLPPAAPFGWIVEAAAADPLRSTAEATGKNSVI